MKYCTVNGVHKWAQGKWQFSMRNITLAIVLWWLQFYVRVWWWSCCWNAYDILEFESLDYFRQNNEIQKLVCVFDLYCSLVVIAMCVMPRCIGQLFLFLFLFIYLFTQLIIIIYYLFYLFIIYYSFILFIYLFLSCFLFYFFFGGGGLQCQSLLMKKLNDIYW